MSAANEAAAGLIPELAQELVEKIPVAGDDQLAADLADATGAQPVEAPISASSEEAAVAHTEHETAIDLPNYTPELPDDLLLELEEPDFEAEAETELASTDDGEEYLYDDQESEERKKRIAAEKRAAHLEQRLLQQNRGKWEAEAKKFFPLSEHALKNIKADSRRAFLREAKAAHETVLPYVKPLIERLGAATEETRTQARTEERQKVRAEWGNPTSGPGVGRVESSAQQTELEAARKTGNLSKIIGVLMKQGGE